MNTAKIGTLGKLPAFQKRVEMLKSLPFLIYINTL